MVKLITCSDVPGCWVHMWRSGTFPEKQVSAISYELQSQTTQQLSGQHWVVLGTFPGFFTAVQKQCATPPHTHPMSRYITAHDQLYQALPVLVLQATNAGVRRPGYEATSEA